MVRIGDEELADQPHLEAARKRLLESSLAYYQEFIDLRRDDPTAQAELEAVRDRVKRILADLAVLQGDRNLFLLDNPAVQDDLKLSREQREQLRDLLPWLNERREESFGDFHKLTAEERSRRFVEQAKANTDAVADVLTDRQVERLGQIELQWRGPMALLDADVASRLKLTFDQRTRIRAVAFDAFRPAPWFGGPKGPRSGPEKRRLPDPAEVRAAMDKALAVLTADQKAQWRQMTGEPYTGPRLMLFPAPLPPTSGPPLPPFGGPDRPKH
jgi:hypothetical protein